MTCSRRAVVAGLALAGVALPARAQMDLKSLLGGAGQVIGAFSASEADEVRIGETHYPQLLAQSGGAVSDRTAQDALRRFAQPLIGAADRKGLGWEITLLDNDQVNAWALPGGKMAVNSALVRHCNHPDELASVIAHEIGHADKGHGLSQMRNQALLQTAGGVGKQALAAWIGGGALGAEVLSALEGPLYGLVLNGYSRTNEFEADHHILGIFAKTGRDPGRAADFFRTLKAIYPQSASETTSLFSTHPGTQERIDRLTADAAKLARPARSETMPGWDDLKSRFPTPAGAKKA
ncbi:MAG: M48 family metalloprotease [Magnetospirillum sp.]|nr:M48 family metalloprotease [Magnetospirillum sp.]